MREEEAARDREECGEEEETGAVHGSTPGSEPSGRRAASRKCPWRNLVALHCGGNPAFELNSCHVSNALARFGDTAYRGTVEGTSAVSTGNSDGRSAVPEPSGCGRRRW